MSQLRLLRACLAAMVLLYCLPMAPALPVRAGDAVAEDGDGPPSVDQDSRGDFALPNGHFFTQSVLDGPEDAGFAVYDGHGASLWTAFQLLGGVDALGYPISRRFDFDGYWAQGFEKALLRWVPEARAGEAVSLSELPEQRLPFDALQPDLPWSAHSEIVQKPWSGWWWPANEALGRPMFAANGPLDKYDQYVARALGENPRTREWERRQFAFPGNGWAGHCNGWAAAALLEPEPIAARTELGVTFTVGDQKGLLSYYHFADAARWTFGEGGSVHPPDFHRALLRWMSGDDAKGFVVTFDMGGGEVWSYPAYRFESAWEPDPVTAYRWRVRTTLWMADMNVPVDFVGLRQYPGPNGKLFEYTLDGDPRDAETGRWTGVSASGRLAHPGRIWYPSPADQNLDHQWISPEIDRGTIMNILGWSPDPIAHLLTPGRSDGTGGQMSERPVTVPDESDIREQD